MAVKVIQICDGCGEEEPGYGLPLIPTTATRLNWISLDTDYECGGKEIFTIQLCDECDVKFQEVLKHWKTTRPLFSTSGQT